MIAPSIHLNGSSAESLLAEYEAAGAALRSALVALGEAAPNARDYYPQGPDAYAQAAREHGSRIERLRAVLEEIAQLHEFVSGAVS